MFGSAPFSSSTFSGEAASGEVGGGAELTLPALTLTVYGGARAVFAIPKPTITASGNYGSRLNLPSLQLNITASGPTYHASIIMNLPALTLSAFGGGHAAIELPSLAIVSNGHDATGENAAALELPAIQMSGHFGSKAALNLTTLALEMAGTFVVVGRAELELPTLTVEASGKAGSVARVSMTLGLPVVAGHFGGVSSITVGGLTVSASGKGGGIGRAAVTLPLFELNVEATAQNHGSAVLELPSLKMVNGGAARLTLPKLSLTAIGTAVVTATYEAYAINLLHNGTQSPVDEVTRYTNFPFDRIIRYKNSYFGVAADGLYLLEGTTDHATPPNAVPWEFKTHLMDFEDPREKTIVSAYFGGRMGKSETITLFAGEKTTKAYKYKTPRGATAQNHREKFGRGIKARYFAIGAEGADGMELDNIEFNINNLTRRI